METLKMKKQLFNLGSLIVIATLLLTSCGAPGAAKVAIAEVDKHWSQTVTMENDVEAQDLLIDTNMNERFSALKIKYPLLPQCYKNWEEAATGVVAGRYDTNAGSTTEPPSGVVDMAKLNNFLVVVEDTPQGLELCNQNLMNYGDEVTAWRLSQIDLFAKLWDMKSDLDTQYYGELGRALAVQLLQKAGTEFMKTDLAAHFAPPKVWYPTFNLEARVYDQGLCGEFADYYPGQASWNPAMKQCHLIGQAAYDKIFSPLLAPEIRDVNDTNIDDLNPIPVTPEQ